MNKNLDAKLKTLPRSAGVYFHKSDSGEIIYVGKAAVLKNRVRQYFQTSRDKDIKTQALVAEIYDTDWIETESEIDALFLESEMVKRYMPRYNVLLRDDRSQLYVRIDMKSDWPVVSFTRNPADDMAEYYGPFYNGYAVKKALRYLRKVFPYHTKAPAKDRVELDVHLGLAPGKNDTPAEYKKNLKKLIRYIKGERKALSGEIEKDMQRAAAEHNFEEAARLRNKLRNLKELQQRIMFGDKEFLAISKDMALEELKNLLGLPDSPRRIEGFDISHMSGTNVVASMVVFSNGVSNRSEYRKFKTKKDHNNDFYNMNETLGRRLSAKNIKAWGTPDLILIDGGKGQLDAALQARDAAGQQNIPFIGLAKREEQIVIHREKSSVVLNQAVLEQLNGRVGESEAFLLLNLPHSSHIIKLLQRIRDESHRFAVSYHTTLKRTQQIHSALDDIAGIGPKTKQKLLKKFGSVAGIKKAERSAVVALVGEKKASLLEFL